ncbi:hypothetical protein, partial [Escherichia coli]|uniref:hypothetical protein n=1 Tax=Escherichia coli TaxID=562 RepID=UPI003D063FE8
ILGWISLLAAGIFLITDQLLLKKKPYYTVKEAIISLVILVSVFILFWGTIYYSDYRNAA